ncbi:MAG: hypothetical protein P8X75_13550 [Limibacillus sp.]
MAAQRPVNPAPITAISARWSPTNSGAVKESGFAVARQWESTSRVGSKAAEW